MAGPYELYLIRHALAEEAGEAWPDDFKRPLTTRGEARMRRAARGLARIGAGFDVIFTSPLVRARQTAEIVVASFEPKAHLVVVDSLAPGGTYPALLADLEKQARKTRIGIVGHAPSIGELAARLIGTRQPLRFKKGAVCRIDVDALPPTGPGRLHWFLTSRILRAFRH